MKNFIRIIVGVLFFYHSHSFADASDPRLKAVQEYILNGNDYPELFKDTPYQMKIEGFAIGDLDSDGEEEVVLLLKPHYLQSPTIIIFRVDNKMNVTRVVEGLAPGPLKSRTDDFLDSHTLGLGVDLEVNNTTSDDPDNSKVLTAMLDKFGGVVEYANWFHVDSREGKKMYIDMKHATVPADQHNCENFEFSTVSAITIASKKTGQGNYLLAYIDKTLYSYKIKKFLPNGMMEKSLEILSAKPGAESNSL